MTFQDQRRAVQAALGDFYTGAQDGEFGPKTEAAFRALATATDALPKQPNAAIAVAGQSGNPRLAIVAELRKLIGGRETDGPNRSPEIDALWQHTSYPNGWRDQAPYCAATICAVCHRAALSVAGGDLDKYPMPTSPSVAGLLEWAQDPKNKCLVFTPADVTAKRQKLRAGDIAIFLPKVSHTGLVAADYTSGGEFQTLEGNTNGAGARDGDGFWAKTRPLSLAGHFIRVASAI